MVASDQTDRALIEQLRTAVANCVISVEGCGEHRLMRAAADALARHLETEAGLREALRSLIPSNCDAIHHDKRDRHDGTSCPVVARALRVLAGTTEEEAASSIGRTAPFHGAEPGSTPGAATNSGTTEDGQ